VNLETAVRELYQVPLGQFVAERKRLAKELAKPDAKALLAKRRPTISAWIVNQLWWHARDAFDRMMETADQLRKGKAEADKLHREAIAKLRARAATLLKDAGHAASEGVLRRVTTTLSAIAAAGGWQPSDPGTLADDLDPPGFGAVGIAHVPTPPAPKSHPSTTPKQGDDDAERKEREAEARRKEHERKELEKKRAKLDDQIDKARAHAERVDDQLEKARAHVAQIEKQLAKAREDVTDLERERRDL